MLGLSLLGALGSISDCETKIPQVTWLDQKQNKTKNKWNQEEALIDIRQLINTCLKIMNEGVNETTTMETVTITNLIPAFYLESSLLLICWGHVLSQQQWGSPKSITRKNFYLPSIMLEWVAYTEWMIHIVLIAASFSALKCNLQCRKFRSKFIIVTILPKAKHVPWRKEAKFSL